MSIGFFGLLSIVFIVLKLVGVIGWSWWFVLMPVYGPAVLFAGAAAAIYLLEQ